MCAIVLFDKISCWGGVAPGYRTLCDLWALLEFLIWIRDLREAMGNRSGLCSCLRVSSSWYFRTIEGKTTGGSPYNQKTLSASCYRDFLSDLK
jgi:hypothetical protein